MRAQLELDSGYVSRLLRSLERQGLVQAEAGPKDGRVRRVTLTREGMTEVVELGRRSDAFAASILAPLSGVQRARLVTAMGEVERLINRLLSPPDLREAFEAYIKQALVV